MKPDSVNNDNVAVALGSLKRDFETEYQIGVEGTPGSYKIDFVIYDTAPCVTAINVGLGGYWHRETAQEAYERAQLTAICAAWGWVYREMPDEDSETVDKAITWLKQEVL